MTFAKFKIIRIACLFLFWIIGLLSFPSFSQTFNYVNSTLNIDVTVSNPCDGSNSNGSINFKVNSANGGSAILVLVAGPNITDFPGQNIAVGSSFTYIPSSPQASPVFQDYEFVVRDFLNNFVINTFTPTYDAVRLTSLPSIVITDDPIVNLTNTSCTSPNGQVALSIAGGSKSLAGGGLFDYTFTTSNALPGFPVTGTFDGTGTLDLAALLGIGGLPGGTYTLTIDDKYSVCGPTKGWTVADPSPVVQTITTSSPESICTGSNISIQLANSEGAAVTYEIIRNGSSLPIPLLFPGTGASPFVMTFPSAGFSSGDIITVRGTNSGCTPVLMTGSVALTINVPPTDATLSLIGTDPICAGQSTTLKVDITGGTGSFTLVIAGQGTVNSYVSGANISVSPVVNTTFTLTSVTDANGCVPATLSGSVPITVNPLPVVSTPSPNLCVGSTMTLSPTTGGTWASSNAAVATVTNAGLVTGLSAGSITFTFTETATGCSNTTPPVTVNAIPIVSTPSPTLCVNSTLTLSPTAGGTWVSSNTAVATVTNAGLVTGVSTGSATFTFTETATGCSNTTSAITVNPLPIVSTPLTALCVGSTMTLSPTTGGTWVSSNAAVATVTNAGLVTGVSAGSVTFTFTETVTGCSEATVLVAIQQPVVSAPSATLCVGSTITLSPTTGGTWVSNNAAVATVTNAGLVTGISIGSITFTFTETATGCSNTTPPVTVNAIPVVSAPSTALCAGSTMTLSPTVGGIWASSDNTVATVTNAGLVTGVSAGSITFTFTETATGCSNTTASVTVNPLPIVTTPSLTLCVGSTMTLGPTTGGTWVSSNAAVATVTNAGLVTGISVGSITFTFTETATGCSNTTASVTVGAIPVVSTPSPTLCVVSTMTLSPTVGGTWASSDNTVATVTNAGLVTGVSAGSITFTFTETATGCSNTTASVTVNPLPIVTTPSLTLCVGSAMTLSPTTGGTWLSSNAAVATVTNAGLVTGVSAGSITFTFTETATGCSNTTASVTVGAIPVVSTPSPTLCVGSTMTLSPTVGGTWASSDNSVATVTNAGIVTGISVGSITFTFTETATGCTNTTSTVTINAIPVVSAPSATLCVGSTLTLSPTTGGIWLSSDNTVATVSNAGLVTGISIGSATFTFTETATGCSNTTTSITIQQPTVSTPSPTLCIGNTLTLSPTTGGTWLSSNNTVATVTNAGLVTGVSSGLVTFTFTETATGCSNTTSTVTVSPLPIVSTPSSALCVGETLTLSPTTGGTWVSSDVTVATVTNAGLVTGVSVGSITFTFTETATGCSNTTSSVSIVVSPAAPTFSFTPNTYCVGDFIVAPSISTPNGTSTYTWYSDAALTTILFVGPNPTTGDVNFGSIVAGTFDIFVTEKIASGCEGPSTQVTLTVNDLPLAPAVTFIPNSYCTGETIIAPFITTPLGTSTYNWYSDPGLGLPSLLATGPAPTSTQLFGGTTAITSATVYVAETKNGCQGAATAVALIVNPIPITPGPGIDTWVGDVFNDAGNSAVPYEAGVDFALSKYRGFITETDIPTFGTSTYNPVTDEFNLDFSNTIPLAGPNVCGSYDKNYSVRFQMQKTFAASGQYVFTVGADDGVNFYIDGLLVPLSPANSFGPPHTYSIFSTDQICITGGSTLDLVIEFYNRFAFSRVSFNYSSTPIPVPSVTISPNVACSGASTTFTATPTNGGATPTYAWQINGITRQLGTSATFTPSTILPALPPLSNGDLIGVIMTTSLTCTTSPSATSSFSLVVITIPPPTVSPTPIQYCQNAVAAPLTATPSGGNTLLWYTTLVGGIGSVTPIVPSTATAGSTDYFVSQTNGTCESSTRATITVIINGLPSDATNPVDNTFCFGSAITPASAISVSNPGIGFIVEWYGAVTGGAVVGIGNSFVPPAAGTYFAQITNTATGCISANRVAATLTPITTSAVISGVATICSGQSTTFSVALTGVGPWDIQYSDGVTTTSVNGIVSSPASISVTPVLGTTTYTLVSVDDASVCTGSVSGSAVINVVNAASITTPAAAPAKCASGGLVDLTTLVTALPSGGTFTFTGTNVTGNNFDPTGLSGLINITVDYSSGTCLAPQANFDIDVTPGAVVTAPIAAVAICQSAALLDMTTLVSAVPAGGIFVFTGTGVSGNNFNPASLSGTQTINVSYNLSGGCNTLRSFQFDVIPTPAITTPSGTTVCQTATPINLLTLVNANPPGGTFTFIGTNVTGNNFDPTGLSGLINIKVDYSFSGCPAPQANFDINVTPGSVVTVPTTPIAICASASAIDMTTLVSAVPAGGTFVFTGTGVSGNNFNPASLSGLQAINVSYNLVGVCNTPKSFQFNVTPTPSITPTNTSICQTAPAINLLTLVNGNPAGGTFTFVGTGVTGTSFNPSSLSGVIPISVNYSVAGCAPAVSSVNVTVLLSTDPLCSGSTNCSVFTTVVTPIRPTCNNQNNGQLTIVVSGGSPGYTVTLSNPTIGFNQALVGVGPFVFGDLLIPNGGLSPSLDYEYTIKDNAGNTCTLPYSLPVQSTVQASADVSSFIDAACFGKPVGKAKLTVTGGFAPYEYSVDNGATYKGGLISGNVINDLPPNGTYNILVRQNSGDTCPASVSVTINNAAGTSPVSTILTPTNATCGNSDGKIVVGTITGGKTPYTFKLNGAAIALPANNTLAGLAADNYIFSIIDNNTCQYDFTTTISTPNAVAFSATTTSPTSCAGKDVVVQVSVSLLPGTFEAAISSQRGVYSFQPVAPNGKFTFTNVSNGVQYVAVRAGTNGCPSEQQVTISGSFEEVSFDEPEVACDSSVPVIRIPNIKAASGPFIIQITKKGGLVPDKSINVPSIPAGGVYNIQGKELPDAKGDYVIRIDQVQGTCLIQSKEFALTYLGALKVNVLNLIASFPDLPTGGFDLINFTGGKRPYIVTIRFDSASNPLIDPSTFVPRTEEITETNNALQFVKNYEKLHAGRYRITVNEGEGCSLEFDVRVPLDVTFDEQSIPNVFTPNEDGSNDTFFIRNLPANTKISIASRWGGEVFASDNYQNDWNGGLNQDGIYYYRISTGDKVITGWVEIIRGK
jgi:gliding motility-associated-like protein